MPPGGWRPARATTSTGCAGPDHDADRDPGQPLPDEAQQPRARRSSRASAPTPTTIALGAASGARRAEREQAVERQRAEGAGRDQRGQLVEGAVADAPMIVVVEAVQLQHEDPDRAEEQRPRRASPRRWSRSGRWRRRARRQIDTQSPAASSRRSSAPRRREPLGPVRPSRVAVSVRRPASVPGLALSSPRSWSAVSSPGLGAHQQVHSPRRHSATGLSRARLFEVCQGCRGFAGLVLNPRTQVVPAASCGPRVRLRGRNARSPLRSSPGARSVGRAGRRARPPRAQSIERFQHG